jgi:ribosomal-protein-alanine N-acetyltransferase
MTLTLRYMRSADIPAVVVIDRLSFDPAWSARSYTYEVNESNYSHMLVLEQTREIRKAGLRRLLRLGTEVAVESEIVGYGGLWNIADEAHISTIATHPQYRGRGWGELLLVAMIRKSLVLRASYIVLEVRVSNVVAQGLYKKYGFETVDVKKHYYSNNGEDAYDMRLPLAGQDAYVARFEERYAGLARQFGFRDDYAASSPPRPHNA